MKVLKFGGTSVGSAERMKHVASIVNHTPGPVVVVLSAMSGTTNELVSLCSYLAQGNKIAAQELILSLDNKYRTVISELFLKEASKNHGLKIVDLRMQVLKEIAIGEYSTASEKTILAQGELLSTELFNAYRREQNQDSTLLPALEFMKTGEEGEPDLPAISKNYATVYSKNGEPKTVITQGFICRNQFGEIDNLKRGGSDYTASLIGAAIGADEIQIWTDIDGMHNNDPRVVDKTQPISELSYDEAAELAYFGAKILHPSSILPARFAKIPVKLKNTMQPEAAGTSISFNSAPGTIKAVAAKEGITSITINSGRMLMAYGFLRAIFEVFERYKTAIDLITTSEVAVSVTIDDTSALDSIVEDLRQFGAVDIEKDYSIVSLVGNNIGAEKGIAFKVMHALKDVSIRMISYGGSKHNISLLVPTKDKVATLRQINSEIFNL